MTYIIIDSKNKFLFQQCGYTIVMPYIYAHTKNLTAFKKKKIYNEYCKDTICSPSPKWLGCKPNEPNTINL